jgi:hypothetical protein
VGHITAAILTLISTLTLALIIITRCMHRPVGVVRLSFLMAALPPYHQVKHRCGQSSSCNPNHQDVLARYPSIACPPTSPTRSRRNRTQQPEPNAAAPLNYFYSTAVSWRWGLPSPALLPLGPHSSPRAAPLQHRMVYLWFIPSALPSSFSHTLPPLYLLTLLVFLVVMGTALPFPSPHPCSLSRPPPVQHLMAHRCTLLCRFFGYIECSTVSAVLHGLFCRHGARPRPWARGGRAGGGAPPRLFPHPPPPPPPPPASHGPPLHSSLPLLRPAPSPAPFRPHGLFCRHGHRFPPSL